jgi:5'-nucleotidase
VRGIRVVPQNVAPYVEKFDRRVDPRGRVYFWTTPDFQCPAPHPDTDVTVLADSYITVTPLQFDLTQGGMLEKMGQWKWTM